MNQTPMNPIVCSECGRSTAEEVIPKPNSVLHWRIAIPAGMALLALTIFVVLVVNSGKSFKNASGGSNPLAVLIDPPLTLNDVRRRASANESDLNPLILEPGFKRICNQWDWTRYVPGDAMFKVAFQYPDECVSKTLNFGWPSSWYHRVQRAQYRDAARRSGFRPFATVPANAGPSSDATPSRSRWFGLRLKNPTANSDGSTFPSSTSLELSVSHWQRGLRCREPSV